MRKSHNKLKSKLSTKKKKTLKSRVTGGMLSRDMPLLPKDLLIIMRYLFPEKKDQIEYVYRAIEGVNKDKYETKNISDIKDHFKTLQESEKKKGKDLRINEKVFGDINMLLNDKETQRISTLEMLSYHDHAFDYYKFKFPDEPIREFVLKNIMP